MIYLLALPLAAVVVAWVIASNRRAAAETERLDAETRALDDETERLNADTAAKWANVARLNAKTAATEAWIEEQRLAWLARRAPGGSLYEG
jgi:cell division protein FtsL